MNKHRKRKIDGVIKAGEMLQRIEKVDTDGKLHTMFYASKGNHDNKRYEGMLGMARKRQTGHAYLMKLEATSDIKVASRDKAAKIFGDLYKNDPDFRRDVESHVKPGLFSRGNQIKNVDDLSNKNIKKMYENFNSNLIGVRYDESGADKKFYNKLKSAGYGAIQDINDMKFSGYNAKNPLIVFDNSNDNIMVKSVSEITGNLKRDARIESRKAAGEIFAKQFIETAGATSAAGITVAAVETYRSTPNNPYETQKR